MSKTRIKRVNGIEVSRRVIGKPEQVIACQHRGEPLRTLKCEICGDERGKDLPVYSCALFGECTHRKVTRVQTIRKCVGCEHGPWAPF